MFTRQIPAASLRSRRFHPGNGGRSEPDWASTLQDQLLNHTGTFRGTTGEALNLDFSNLEFGFCFFLGPEGSELQRWASEGCS